MKNISSKITFKRIVIVFILIVLALPLLKSVFWKEKKESVQFTNYEYEFVRGDELSTDKILQIPLSGVIMTEATSVPGPLDFLSEGVTYGYDVKESFRRASEDESIKGILLTINSPGGTIPGSNAISEGIELYKQRTGNPVYAHIRDVGASGAYWAAVTTDKIFVDTGSIIGSIGVLMGPFVYYDRPVEEGSFLGSVTTENGIEHTYITGGTYKDTGSPYRRLTPEERDHWQRSIDNEYTIFVNHVSRYRNIPRSTIIDQIKALPYDSLQARNLKLIDEIGSEDRALEALARTAGVSDSYQFIYEKTKTDFIERIFSVISESKTPTATQVCGLCNTPLYLYDRTYNLYAK